MGSRGQRRFQSSRLETGKRTRPSRQPLARIPDHSPTREHWHNAYVRTVQIPGECVNLLLYRLGPLSALAASKTSSGRKSSATALRLLKSVGFHQCPTKLL